MPPIVAPLTGHLDAALTEFAKRFTQDGLIADMIAPIVPVGRQTDVYWIYGRESFYVGEKQLRATGAPAERIRMSLSKDSYFSRSHALASDIADEDRAAYGDVGDIEQDAVQTMTEKIQLQREVELATMLSDTAQVTNNVSLTGGDQFSDYANSKPGVVIETGKSKIRQSGKEATHLVLGEPVYTQLVNHPAIRKFFINGGARDGLRALTSADLALYFGVPNVLVGRAVQDDKDAASSFVWGKVALLMYVQPGASRRDVSAVKTFRWSGAPGTAGGIGVVKDRNPDPTAKADIVGVDDYYQQKITAVETAYLVATAVA